MAKPNHYIYRKDNKRYYLKTLKEEKTIVLKVDWTVPVKILHVDEDDIVYCRLVEKDIFEKRLTREEVVMNEEAVKSF